MVIGGLAYFPWIYRFLLLKVSIWAVSWFAYCFYIWLIHDIVSCTCFIGYFCDYIAINRKQSQANTIHFNWCNTFDLVTLKFTRAIQQVLIRYGKYSNATLMLDFGFTLPYNIHDQVSYGNLDWRKLLRQWRTMVIV